MNYEDRDTLGSTKSTKAVDRDPMCGGDPDPK